MGGVTTTSSEAPAIQPSPCCSRRHDHRLLRDCKPAIGKTGALVVIIIRTTAVSLAPARASDARTFSLLADFLPSKPDHLQQNRRAPAPNLQWDFHAGNRRDSSLRCRRRTPAMTVAVFFRSRFYRKSFHKLPTRLPACGQSPRSSAGREVSMGTAAWRSWGGRTHGERSVSVWASPMARTR